MPRPARSPLTRGPAAVAVKAGLRGPWRRVSTVWLLIPGGMVEPAFTLTLRG